MPMRERGVSSQRLTRQRVPRDLSDLLAIAEGQTPPNAPATNDGDDESKPKTVLVLNRTVQWLSWPIEDRAWQLYLRGWTLAAIARELGTSEPTASKYVRAAICTQEPIRREQREQWLQETISRLRNVQAHAWEQWDQTGEYGLLNTITVAEREIAKLRGLYDVLAEDTGGDGVTIRITRHQGGGSGGGDHSAADVGIGTGMAGIVVDSEAGSGDGDHEE